MSVEHTSVDSRGAAVLTEENQGVYATLFSKINLHPVSALANIETFQNTEALSEASADERVTAAVSVFLSLLKQSAQKIERLDKTLLDVHIASLDAQISRQLDAVMHHPDFQRVESTWRGVKSLIDQTDFRQNVRVELLDISKEHLVQDFEDAPEVAQSGLYVHTYIQEYDTPGGEPIAAAISNYEFDRSPQDIALLRNISKVAAAAYMPFIGAVGPAFFGKDSMEEVAAIKDIGNYFDRAEYIKWKSFRDSDDSRYIGLTMPRVLGRLPYGPDTLPVRSFNYIESVKGPDHDKYLWTNASFAFAANMVKSFINNGWCVQIRGPQSGGAVTDLPIHLYDLGIGNQVKIPSEVMIPETREFEFANLGFIPLSYYKNRDYACFFSANSTQKPALYDTADATANSRINSRLPYIFLLSRIAHYLKLIQRENIGTTKDRRAQQLEQVRACLEKAGLSERSIDHICYAQCALLDETLLGCAKEDAHSKWANKPLQAELFNRHQAGESLYEDMREVLRAPAPDPHVLTAFQRVLMLGFQGRYRDVDDPEREQLLATLNAQVFDLGMLRLNLTPALSGFIGASVMVEGQLQVVVQGDQQMLAGQPGGRLPRFTERKTTGAKFHQQMSSEDEGLTLSGEAFAGARVEGSLRGALQWLKPAEPVDLDGKSVGLLKSSGNFTDFCSIGPSIAAMAGAGIGGKFYCTFINGKFCFHVAASLCWGIGAKGSLICEVGVDTIVEFGAWLVYQLYRLNYRFFDVVDKDAFKAYSQYCVIKIGAVKDEFSAFYGTTKATVEFVSGKFQDFVNNFAENARDHLEASGQRNELARNIIERHQELLRHTPEAKGILLYLLTRHSKWDSLDRGNHGDGLIPDIYQDRKEAVLWVLKSIQTLAEWRKVLCRLTPDGKSMAKDDNEFAIAEEQEQHLVNFLQLGFNRHRGLYWVKRTLIAIRERLKSEAALGYALTMNDTMYYQVNTGANPNYA